MSYYRNLPLRSEGGSLKTRYSTIDWESCNENVGLSPVKTWENPATRGTEVPKDTWDISSEGQYDFAGQSAFHTLYTSYLFTGKTSYSISCYNEKAYADYLEIEVFKKNIIGSTSLTTKKVQGQTTENFTVKDRDKKDKLYIAFYIPVHCKGYIK